MPDNTTADNPVAATPPTPAPAKPVADKPSPPPAPVEQAAPSISFQVWATDPRRKIVGAGLLAAEPDLRTAKLTAAEWQTKLAQYEHSPRP